MVPSHRGAVLASGTSHARLDRGSTKLVQWIAVCIGNCGSPLVRVVCTGTRATANANDGLMSMARRTEMQHLSIVHRFDLFATCEGFVSRYRRRPTSHRHRRRSGSIFLVCALLTLCSFEAPQAAEDAIDYLRDVKPLLQTRCYACHGALKQQAGLRLDTAVSILRGGESGADRKSTRLNSSH